MKKFLLVVCVVALIAVASAGAYATTSSWLISIKALTLTGGGNAAAMVGVGTTTETNTTSISSNGGAVAERTGTDTAYHVRHDVAQQAVGAEDYSWNLKIGAKSATVPGTTVVNICLWNNQLANLGAGGELDHALVYGFYKAGELVKWFSDDVELMKANALAKDAAYTVDKWVSTSQLLKAASNWSPTTANWGYFIQDTVTNSSGAWADVGDYSFQAFYAPTPETVTPEPGSFMALGSGLIGLAGFAIRRRK